MECKLSHKVRFALNRLPNNMTFLEVTHGGDTVIRLFSNMGKETRAVEIVTEPLRIEQEKKRNQNFRIMAFLEDFLERYSAEQGTIPDTVTRTQVNEALSVYTNLENNADLKGFKVKLLCSVLIVKDVTGNNQMPFGMRFDEVRVLLRSMEWSCDGHMASHMFPQKVRRMNAIKRYTIISCVQLLVQLICICMTVRLVLRAQKPGTAGDWCQGQLRLNSYSDYKCYRGKSVLDGIKDFSYMFSMSLAGGEEEADGTNELDGDSRQKLARYFRMVQISKITPQNIKITLLEQ